MSINKYDKVKLLSYLQLDPYRVKSTSHYVNGKRYVKLVY